MGKSKTAKPPAPGRKVRVVTIGIREDVYGQLDAMRREYVTELGGVHLSWSDFVQVLINRVKVKG